MNKVCNKNCCENKSTSSYIKRILEILGPVILGSKPAEILNVSGKIDAKKDKLNNIQSFFNNCSKISYHVINTHDGGIRVLFINKKSLSEVLSNKKSVNFLKFVGYPSNYDLDEYLNILINKLNSDDFPHEIGIFLGYPLKDVLGFMGYGKNELFEIKGWRIYGDPLPSYEVSNNFLRDRSIMKDLISSTSIHELRKTM